MMIQRLYQTQLIKRNLADVFSFFENPQNLAKITPPKMGFKILTPLPIRMRQGTLIDYVVNIMAVPVRWTSLITEYDPPHKFVDEQLKGPYSFWHHEHFFRATPDGTVIEDVVHYSLPLGFLGRLVEPILVRPQLKAIFEYRQRVIADFFGPR